MINSRTAQGRFRDAMELFFNAAQARLAQASNITFASTLTAFRSKRLNPTILTIRGFAMSGPSVSVDLLLQHHVTPTFVLDPQGRVSIWNEAIEALTGLKAADVVGTSEHWRGFYKEARPCLADLILQDRIEAVEELYATFSDLQVSRGAIVAENWCVIPLSGRRLYVSIEAVPIRAADGKLLGVLEAVRDLTATKEAEAKLRSLAGLDALTGIANRRTFNETLASEWRRAMRARNPLSLLIVDIDHFKQFNDSLGHQRGDECLRAVAVAMADVALRAGDLPARYGGEEFAIVLPATDHAGAALIAEKVRTAIEHQAIQHPLSSVGPHVTVSIGAATVVPVMTDRLEKLMCFADVALYRAKEGGRNQVCAFHDGPTCAIARRHPTAGVEIPVSNCAGCSSCRAGATKVRLHS